MDMIGQPLAIHAGKTLDDEACVWLHEQGFEVWDEADLPSAIVAVATVAGFVKDEARIPEEQRVWWCGPYGWVLRNVRALRDPVPCRGNRGLWDVPADVLARVMAQLPEETAKL